MKRITKTKHTVLQTIKLNHFLLRKHVKSAVQKKFPKYSSKNEKYSTKQCTSYSSKLKRKRFPQVTQRNCRAFIKLSNQTFIILAALRRNV